MKFVIFYLFIIFGHITACGISVSWLVIEPRPWLWKPGVLTTWPPGNSLIIVLVDVLDVDVSGNIYFLLSFLRI